MHVFVTSRTFPWRITIKMFPVCLLIFLVSIQVPVTSASVEELQLLKALLSDYNVNNRPIERNNESLLVTMDLALNQIIDLDESNELLKVKLWVRLAWNDWHLQWDPDKYGGIESINMQPSLIWKPDITLYPDVSEPMDISGYRNQYLAAVTWQGDVQWNMPYVFSSSCGLNMLYFPHDKQECPLKFGSWTLPRGKLDLVNKTGSADLSNYECSGEWILIGMPVNRNIIDYPTLNSSYVDLTYTLIILRKPLFIMFNLIFPCIVVTITALLVFCLPAQSGEKVSLGVTILLALTVFLLLVAQTIPPQSDSIPMASQFFGATIVLLAFSTGMTVITLNLHHTGDLAMPVPKAVRTFFLDWLGTVLFLRPCLKQSRQRKRHPKARMYSMSSRPGGGNNTVVPSINGEANNGSIDLAHNNHSQSLSGHSSSMFQPPTTSSTSRESSDTYLAGILDVLEDIRDKWRGQEDASGREHSVSDWALVAMVFDRLLFVLFVIGAAAMMGALLSSQPNYDSELDIGHAKCAGT